MMLLYLRQAYSFHLVYLLCSSFLLRLCVAQIIYQRDIIFDDETHVLHVNAGQEPIDAIYAFEKLHGLESYRETLYQEVCKRLDCKRTKAKVWSTVVNKGNSYVGTFELFEDMEPVDAAHAFVSQYGLSIGYRNAILKEACDNVECNRIRPIVWTKAVNIDKNLVKIDLLEGDEVVDAIFEALSPYKVSLQDRRRLLDIARADGVAFSRDKALVFSKDIVLENDFNHTLVVYDDGREPIDILNVFAEKHNVEHAWEALIEKVLPMLCAKIACTRSTPVVWSHPVVDGQGEYIGTLDVKKNEEPIDAVYRFSNLHNILSEEAFIILQFVCGKMKCTRDRPVVYRKTINNENDKGMGTVEIYQGEEVIDAVVRFIRTTNIELDHVAFKNHFFNNACGNAHVKCTRNIGHVYENDIKDENGKLIGRLAITEYDEPSDKVYEFCKSNNLNDDHYQTLIESVCSDDLVMCKRKLPLKTSIPMRDPDGNMIGDFEVQLNEEPVDSLYRFFAANDLFKKKWDFHSVLNQICDLPNVDCQRKEAIKYYSDSILMGGKEIGPLIVWEHEEVIDVLFDRRIKNNLTETDQMITFGEICTKKEVYCERTQAKVYELKDITIKDYENFGNETCARKFAGWQFLESFVQSSVGSKARDFIQIKSVEQVRDLFINSVILGIQVLLTMMFVSFIETEHCKSLILPLASYSSTIHHSIYSSTALYI